MALCAILLLAPEARSQGIKVTRKTYTISGTVGLSGVTMQGLPGAPTTDENGVYSVEVTVNWSGKVTPVKLGYTFEPRERQYQRVTANISGDDYVAKLLTFTISGSTREPGVRLTGFPEEVVSDQNGRYTATVDFGWSSLIVPEKMGFRFDPSSRPYSQVKEDHGNDNYTPHELTFTVSGNVGAPGILMKGFDTEVVSTETGEYRAKVGYGWSGTVTPTREGYEFSPPSLEYSVVTSDMPNQSYTAQIYTYEISGTAGLSGVVMKGLPDDPITDTDGYYRVTVPHGWSGKVTPERAGYTFEPSSRTYPSVKEAFESQDYNPEIIYLNISGKTGTGNVILEGLSGDPTSDAAGAYSAKVEYGWAGSITPVKEGWSFEPSTQVFSGITQNTQQDFKATPVKFRISGNVGQPGVTMQGFPTSVVSGADGSYNVEVDYKWSGTVTPKKPGYTFQPASQEYTDVLSPLPGEDYYAEVITFTISGKVTDEAGPVADVLLIADNDGGSTMTDANGEFQFQVDYGWKGRITPEKDGYTINPPTKPFEPVVQNIPNANFSAKIKMLMITRMIKLGDEPIAGVRVKASPTDATAITDARGKFIIRVPYGWTGDLTLDHDEFVFDPNVLSYMNVTDNIDETAPKPTSPITPPTTTTTTTTTLPPPTPPTTTATTTATTLPPTTTATTTIPPVPGTREQLLAQLNQVQQDLDMLWAQANSMQASGGAVSTELLMQINQKQVERQTLQAQLGPLPTTPPPDGARPPVMSTQPTTNLVDVLTRIAEDTGAKIAIDATVKPVPVSLGFDVKGFPVPYVLQRVIDSTPEASVYKYKPVGDTYLVYKPITNMFQGEDLREALQNIALTAGVPIIPDATVTGEAYAEITDQPLETALEILLGGTPFVVKRTPNYYLVASRAPEGDMFPEVSVTRTIRLSYIQPEKAVGLLSPAFQKYVKAENAIDPNTGLIQMAGGGRGGHFVTVTAAPTIVDRIIEDLKRFDVRPRHVLLDARVVVMEEGDMLNLGVEWGFPTLQAGLFNGSFLSEGDVVDDSLSGIQIGYTPDATFTNSLMAALNLLKANSKADIIANPQVLAQDGRESQIQAITEEWFMMSDRAAGIQDFGFFSRSELQKVESGTTLTITPFIGDTNDITLEMAVEVSDNIPRGRESDLPVVTRRKARNVVTVRDGGTVALAGLTENRSREREKRVPGLSNIPLIGALFRNNDSDKATREVAVFVTAHLVPEASAVAFERSQPQAAMPAMSPTPMGVQPAGDDFRLSLEEALMRQNGQ